MKRTGDEVVMDLSFAWREWGKALKYQATIADAPSKCGMWYLLNESHIYYYLSCYAEVLSESGFYSQVNVPKDRDGIVPVLSYVSCHEDVSLTQLSITPWRYMGKLQKV